MVVSQKGMGRKGAVDSRASPTLVKNDIGNAVYQITKNDTLNDSIAVSEKPSPFHPVSTASAKADARCFPRLSSAAVS